MGLRWRLAETLATRHTELDDLAMRLDFAIDERWLGPEPPTGVGLAELAALCEALGCQPGDLLGYDADSPEEQAAANLANDLFYQSFLAHRSGLEDED